MMLFALLEIDSPPSLADREDYYDGTVFTASTAAYIKNDVFLVMARMLEDVSYTVSAGNNLLGITSIDFGSIVLTNGRGELDWLKPDEFVGRFFTVKTGLITDSYSSLSQVLTGVVHEVTVDETSVTLRINTREDGLNRRSGGSIITIGPSIGRIEPIAIGSPRNVTPILVDATIDKYQISAGLIDTGTVIKDKGLAVTGTKSYTTTGSFITLTSRAIGLVTADVLNGRITGGTIDTKAGAITQSLLETYGGFVTADFDTTSLTQLDTDSPKDQAIYIDEAPNLADTVDSVMRDAGAMYGFDVATGKLWAKYIDYSADSNDHTIIQSQILRINAKSSHVREYQMYATWDKNWTPMDWEDFAATVTDADRAEMMIGGKVTASAFTGIGSPYLPGPEIRFQTNLIDSIDVADIIEIQGKVYLAIEYDIEMIDPGGVKLGDVLGVTHERAIQGGTAEMIVTKISKTLLTPTIRVTAWQMY